MKKGKSKNGKIRITVLTIVLLAIASGLSLFYYYRIGNPHSMTIVPVAAYSSSITKPVVQTSQYVTEYSTFPDASTNAIATDNSGDVWFTIGSETLIGELITANQTLRTYQLPEPKNTTILSWGIVVDSSTNLVWFTDQISNSVWSFNATDHDFMQYALPNPRSSPYQIVIDQIGNVWFTELDGGRLGEITTNGVIKEYQVPLTSTFNTATNSTGPSGIAISKDGTVWFAEAYGNSVGSFSGGIFTQYDLNSYGVNSPTGIAIDSRGDIWITQHGGSLFSEFDPITNQLTTISTSVVGVQESLPYFIQIDSQDNIWFNEHYGNAIAKYNPENGTLIEYEVPSRVSDLGNISGVLTLTLSPNGSPWFTELYTGKIGTVNISQPIDLSVHLSNITGSTVTIPSSGSVSLGISISSLRSTQVSLSSYGANGSNLDINFSRYTGSGNFSSQLVISEVNSNGSIRPEIVTISAQTSQLIVSQVLLVEPRG
jgi:virginiamycin B lyase